MNRRSGWLVMPVLAALALAATPAWPDDSGRHAATVLVKTAPVAKKTLPVLLTAYGTVQPDSGNTVHMVVPRAGQVTKLVVSPGQEVRRGQQLFEFATGAATLLGYQQAASTVKFATADLARTRELFKERLATNTQVATAEKTLSDAQDALKAQERVGAGRSVQWIVSPGDAIVTEVNAKVGDRLDQGGTVLQLTERGAVQIMLGIEPEDVDKVHAGMPVAITSVFDPSRTIAGKIDGVHGMIDPQTRLVDAVVRMEGKPAAGLLPNMRVQGVITTGEVTGWVVPRQAVLTDDQGAYVYQIKDGQAQRAGVKILLDSDDVYVIDGALDPKLPLVTLGNYELSDGQPVREAAAAGDTARTAPAGAAKVN